MEQNGHNGELNDASTSGASSSKATTTNSATTSLNELTRGVDSLLTMLSEVDQDKRDLIDAADAERREGVRNVQHFARLQADDAHHIVAQLRGSGFVYLTRHPLPTNSARRKLCYRTWVDSPVTTAVPTVLPRERPTTSPV